MPPTSDDVATSFATDENGNTYISGYGGSHNITIKYDTHGDTVWTSRLNGFLYSASIASHASGNVYVAVNSGFFTGSSSIIKFNHAGDTLWVSKYPGDATFLKVDSSGNIYVTGRNIVAGTYTDVTTTKYTSSGETVWMLSYNGPGNSSDGGGILDIDKSGNVYVAASVYGSSGTYEYATIKYGPNGNFLWARNYRGNGRREDIPYAIAVDANENVYVTGSLSSSLMPQGDYGTLKYNSAGDLVWVRQYNGSYVNEEASALAIDGDGNVLVTGTSGSGFVTIKYNPSGEVLWLKRYESSEPDRVNVLILDAEGNVYLGGTSDHCFVVIKYDTMGNQQWIVQYSYAGGTSMLAGLGLDARNNVYIAGTSRLDDESFFTVIKYVQRPTSVKEVENAVPKNFALEQNYPNPFNPSTTIRYALPSSAHVKLTVYNLLGQRVCELVNEEQSAGWKEVRWNAKNFASGIYIVQMQCGSFTETKKILLVK
jgi:hypothetical protein